MTEEVIQGETQLEQSHEKTPEEVQHDHEKNAFITHVNTSDEVVPDNFENASVWFDSLKEAQKQFTQARQEISELKAEVEVIPQPTVPVENQLTNELRLPIPGPEDDTQPSAPTGITEEVYDTWAVEFAASGNFSEDTKNEIKSKTGFTDRMLDDYVEAQKSRLRESYASAATVVGGQDRLDKIFKWASNSLSTDEMQNINLGLSSPSYEVTLRGLASMYENSVLKDKKAEPAPNPNLTQVAASQTGILPYANQREFKAERDDPKFTYEPGYRDIVQKRMAITDWNTLPV